MCLQQPGYLNPSSSSSSSSLSIIHIAVASTTIPSANPSPFKIILGISVRHALFFDNSPYSPRAVSVSLEELPGLWQPSNLTSLFSSHGVSTSIIITLHQFGHTHYKKRGQNRQAFTTHYAGLRSKAQGQRKPVIDMRILNELVPADPCPLPRQEDIPCED